MGDVSEMAKAEGTNGRNITSKQEFRYARKWINHLLLQIEELKKEDVAIRKEIESLREQMKKFEQRDRPQCSSNSSV